MRIALVHDYLTQLGGAERVLLALHELYPTAPIYTALYDEKRLGPYFKNTRVIIPSFAHWPGGKNLGKVFTFFYPWYFESLDLRSFDVIISSSSNFAKGIITHPHSLHISYCHTPPRFLYHYSTETNWRKNSITKSLLAPLDSFLRIWDYTASQRVDFFIANSKEVKSRIEKFYRRESVVIYPPAEISLRSHLEKVRPSKGETFQKGYFLAVSRLSAYKNVEIIVEACKRLNLPLIVVGGGREEGYLRRFSTTTIRIIGVVSDQELAELYQGCEAVICATSEEDFGIVPVEAMLFGKPVIALRSGGYKETVIEDKTGLFFNQANVESLRDTLSFWQTNNMSEKFNSTEIKEWAQKFGKERFKKEIQRFIEDKWNEKVSKAKYF